MELYNYFRSSASYRVRIALALKGLDYDYMPVHLAKNEQFTESYAAVSAARLVPLLRDGENLLTQSLAIIEYLEELHPEPPLLPGDGSAAPVGPCPGAGRGLRNPPAEQPARAALPHAGPEAGRRREESLVPPLGGDRARGRRAAARVAAGHLLPRRQTRRMADCVLVPQIFNARRFECRLDHVPQVMRVFDHCMKLDAFERTRPENCPDAT
jgi:glutathione S-transferase